MSIEKDNIHEIFRAALFFCIELYGVKAIQLAESTGIKRGRISEILSAKYKPGLKIQTKIASAFNKSLAEFLALGEDKLALDSGVEAVKRVDSRHATQAKKTESHIESYLEKTRSLLEGTESKALEAVIDALFFDRKRHKGGPS